MKKLITLLLVFILLSSCSSKEKSSQIEIISPSGATAIGLLPLFNRDDISIEIVDGPEVLQSEFVNKQKDIIIAPINLGVNLSNKTKNYQLLAVLTWGNLFLFQKDEKIDNLAAFSEFAIPGKVTNMLFEDYQEKIDYFDSAVEASQAFLTDKYDACIIAEPMASKIRNKVDLYNEISLSLLWIEKYNFDSYPQAAIFVNKESDIKIINSLIEQLIEDNKKYITDTNYLKSSIENVGIEKLGFNDLDLIVNCYKDLAINPMFYNDCKNEVKFLLNIFDLSYED